MATKETVDVITTDRSLGVVEVISNSKVVAGQPMDAIIAELQVQTRHR